MLPEQGSPENVSRRVNRPSPPVMDIEAKLESTPLAPKEARRFVAAELAALGYHQLIDDACLIVSELTTNSLRYALLDEGGRGIQVVNELGVSFGYDTFYCGKVVWVILGGKETGR